MAEWSEYKYLESHIYTVIRMSLFGSTLEKYTMKLNSTNKNAKMARQDDNLDRQQMLAESANYWVQLNLIHNPRLHPVVQGLFVNWFGGLAAEDFVSGRKNLKQKLQMQNTLTLMNRLADHPNLDEDLHGRITTAVIRLDDEAAYWLSEGELDRYMAEDILHGVRGSVRMIASNLINNPTFNDRKLREQLSKRFDITVRQSPLWSSVEAERSSVASHDVWSNTLTENPDAADQMDMTDIVYAPERIIWGNKSEQ